MNSTFDKSQSNKLLYTHRSDTHPIFVQTFMFI